MCVYVYIYIYTHLYTYKVNGCRERSRRARVCAQLSAVQITERTHEDNWTRPDPASSLSFFFRFFFFSFLFFSSSSPRREPVCCTNVTGRRLRRRCRRYCRYNSVCEWYPCAFVRTITTSIFPPDTRHPSADDFSSVAAARYMSFDLFGIII